MHAIPTHHLQRFDRPNGFAAGVYRLRSAERALLYVGCGASPLGRLKVHEKRALWWPEVDLDQSSVEWFKDYELATIAEKLAIRLERPSCNMIYSRTRPHWSHERGCVPHRAPFNDGDGVTQEHLRSTLIEVLRAVRVERSCLFIDDQYGRTPNAGIVPTELARLARRVGGADVAAGILLDIIRQREAAPTDL